MLFSESAIKATHFIQLCGQRNIPLIFMQNITGFIIGTSYEQGGITKDGCKMITAMSNVPVPKICLIVGGSHGAGNYAMCGTAFDPRFVFLWPNAKISVMGGEQAASVISQVRNAGRVKKGKPPMTKEEEAMIKEPIISMIDGTATAYHSTADIWDDGVIDPKDTRKTLAMALAAVNVGPRAEDATAQTTRYGVFRQ